MTMKHVYSLVIAMFLTALTVQAQRTTAMNFVRNDCNGRSHDLFAELDSGDLVILEFFMTCSSCKIAADKIQSLISSYEMALQNRIRFYMMSYNNTYSCQTAASFLSTSGIKAVAFDSGAAQVAYYGGFGMPTIVILGGKDHRVLYTGIGFSSSDMVEIGDAIKNHFAPAEVSSDPDRALLVQPQPADQRLSVRLPRSFSSDVSLELIDAVGRPIVAEYTLIPDGDAQLVFVNTATLASGVYRLCAHDGNMRATHNISIIH